MQLDDFQYNASIEFSQLNESKNVKQKYNQLNQHSNGN